MPSLQKSPTEAGFKVLSAFIRQPHEPFAYSSMTAQQIQRRTQLRPANVNRILNRLADDGFMLSKIQFCGMKWAGVYWLLSEAGNDALKAKAILDRAIPANTEASDV